MYFANSANSFTSANLHKSTFSSWQIAFNLPVNCVIKKAYSIDYKFTYLTNVSQMLLINSSKAYLERSFCLEFSTHSTYLHCNCQLDYLSDHRILISHAILSHAINTICFIVFGASDYRLAQHTRARYGYYQRPERNSTGSYQYFSKHFDKINYLNARFQNSMRS